MISTTNLSDIPDSDVPKLKVKIIRRKSVSEDHTERLKKLLFPDRNKRLSIPRIEIAYKDFDHNILMKTANSFNECRPTTSPISVVLKNQDVAVGLKICKRSKPKIFPIIRRDRAGNTENLRISGNSVKSYDWVSSFLNYSPDLKFCGDGKNVQRKFSETPNKNKLQRLLRRRLYKGRCLIPNN